MIAVLFALLLQNNESPTMEKVKELPRFAQSCLLSAICAAFQRNPELPQVKEYVQLVYNNRDYFLSSPKQSVRVSSYKLCCWLAETEEDFVEFIHLPILKNNSTYLEDCKFSLMLFVK